MGAGEGSRGGKVVGHSASGRPIYAKEATAKAALGLDPHAGARVSTAHAPLNGGQGPRTGTMVGPSGKTIGKETSLPPLRLRGNLDRPAVFNKPGYKPH